MFEKYVPVRRKTTKTARPTVTFWTSGEMRFSEEAIRKYQVDDFLYAELFFDEPKRVLGIRLSPEKREGALKLKRSKNGTTLRIEGLLAHYGLPIRQSLVRPLTRDKESGMLLVRLRGVGRRAAGNARQNAPR